MKRPRFNEEQIIGILREHEAGMKTAEVYRKYGINSATFFKWKSKYGGLDASDARRLKILEDENRKLKKLFAETMLDIAMRDQVVGEFLDVLREFRAADITNISPPIPAIVRTDWNRHHSAARSDQFGGGEVTVQVCI